MRTKLIEIYLFIDPLGKKCNSARKVIKKFHDDHMQRIKLRVIPIVNSKKVLRHAKKKQFDPLNSLIDKNNKFSTNTYKACLAFHASTMQGKKVGYKFLTHLQSEVVEEKNDFSEELVYEIAEEIEKLDSSMFQEDYQSKFTQKIYKRNLELAAEMNISKTPSCVIIKNGVESDAIRVNREIEDELLHTICGLDNISTLEDYNKDSSEEKMINNILNLNS